MLLSGEGFFVAAVNRFLLLVASVELHGDASGGGHSE